MDDMYRLNRWLELDNGTAGKRHQEIVDTVARGLQLIDFGVVRSG